MKSQQAEGGPQEKGFCKPLAQDPPHTQTLLTHATDQYGESSIAILHGNIVPEKAWTLLRHSSTAYKHHKLQYNILSNVTHR